MRYFLTGGTGFVGGHVARHLLADDHEVVALARTPSRAADHSKAGAEVVTGDVTEKASMREGMTGADGVFHIAGWYEVGAADPTPADYRAETLRTLAGVTYLGDNANSRRSAKRPPMST